MYSGPDENADVVSQALYGTTVAVLEERGEWAKIRTPDDYPGWILSAMRRVRRRETICIRYHGARRKHVRKPVP
jgi:SH3-like domain-containing protein